MRNSSQRPTRLKLRVLAGKFSKFTSRRLSPVVVGAERRRRHGGGGGGGRRRHGRAPDDSDHDNDLLSNSLEKSLGTDPCLADTDNDSMIDGWEYYAAKDLNIKAVPYPGKRPFPNALDPSDGKSGEASAWDFDGDGLKSYEEYRAWRRTGSSFNAAAVGGSDAASPLGYSDGTKTSRPGEVPGVPAWRSCRPTASPTRPSPSRAPTRSIADGAWHDDERDADADGLSNWLEASRGPGHVSWWASLLRLPGEHRGGVARPRRTRRLRATRRSSERSASGPSRSST